MKTLRGRSALAGLVGLLRTGVPGHDELAPNLDASARRHPRNPSVGFAKFARFGNTVVSWFAGTPSHAAIVAPY